MIVPAVVVSPTVRPAAGSLETAAVPPPLEPAPVEPLPAPFWPRRCGCLARFLLPAVSLSPGTWEDDPKLFSERIDDPPGGPDPPPGPPVAPPPLPPRPEDDRCGAASPLAVSRGIS